MGGRLSALRALALLLLICLLSTVCRPPAAHAACASPAGPAGMMLYNSVHSVPQYCDDTNWVRMAPPSMGLTENGLIGWWKLNESGNVSTAADSIGTNTGTLTNFPGNPSASWVAGMIAGSLDFDGANDHINAGNTTALDNIAQFTVSAWIRPDSLGKNTRGTIVNNAQGGAAAPTAGWTFRLTSNSSLEFSVDYNTTDLVRRTADNTIKTGLWSHVVLTWTGSATATNARVYINGTETAYSVTTDGGTNRVDDSAATLRMGDTPDGSSNFDGRIDDVRIYNRVLSAAEIGGCCIGIVADKGDLTSGLIGHWKLDETTGTAADDAVSTNDGTLQGGMNAANDAVAGVRGGAFDFDGVDDRVQVNNNAALNVATGTVSLWYKVYSYSTNLRTLVARDDNGDNLGDILIYIRQTGGGTSNKIAFETNNGTVEDTRYSNVGTPLNKWVHVAVTCGPAGKYMYVDGVLQTDSAPSVTSCLQNTGGEDMTIGGEGSADPFNGSIDDVRIYNRALIANDVKALYMNSARYCENPNGVTGQIEYNLNAHAPMYCDGGHWVELAPDPLSKGLIARWKFDETTGTSAADTLGNIPGTWSGSAAVTSSAGMLASAFSFDGVDDAVDLGSPASLDNLRGGMTASIWINPASLGEGSRGRLFDKASTTAGDDGWELFMFTSNVIRLSVGCGGATIMDRDSANATVPNNKWTHVLMTWDGTCNAAGAKIYIDGVYSNGASGNGAGSPDDDNAQDFLIGNETGGTRTFNGNLDDARIYNRILSDAEITALYNDGVRDDGLIAHWPLNEDGGTIADDVAGGYIGYASTGIVTFSSTGGKIGGAVTLDGTAASFINFGDLTQLNNASAFTIMGWAKDVSYATDSRILSKNPDVNNDILLSTWSDDRFYAEVGNGSNSYGYLPGFSTIVAAGNWYHYAVVFDGSGSTNATRLKLYINGTLRTLSYNLTIPATTSASLAGVPLLLGKPTAGTNAEFDGMLDDTRVYNRALTAAEILKIYTAGNAGFAARDCASPDGAEGTMIYNTNVNAVQYCNGTNWVKLGKR